MESCGLVSRDEPALPREAIFIPKTLNKSESMGKEVDCHRQKTRVSYWDREDSNCYCHRLAGMEV